MNVSLFLVARGVIAVVRLPAEGGTRRVTAPGRVVEALVKGQVGAAGVLPLHDAERGAFLDLLPQKVGGAKGALAIVAAALPVNPRLMQAARTSIAVA